MPEEAIHGILERFSEPARVILFIARAQAGRSGSKAIEPDHLLFGFLIEDQGTSTRFLAAAFGDPEAQSSSLKAAHEPFLNQKIAGQLHAGLASLAESGEPTPDNVDMPLAEVSQQVLETAAEHAGPSLVSPLHILKGLMNHTLLEPTGITTDQIDAAIMSDPRHLIKALSE
jgi:hypothetical protein